MWWIIRSETGKMGKEVIWEQDTTKEHKCPPVLQMPLSERMTPARRRRSTIQVLRRRPSQACVSGCWVSCFTECPAL